MDFDLVFEGGGVKGVAFIGALSALEAADIRPKRLLGSSAGAIMATLVAAGYQSDQLYTAFTERTENGKLKLGSFTDAPGPFSDEMLQASSWAKILKRLDVPVVPESAEQNIDQLLLRGLTSLPLFKQLFSLVERGGIYAGSTFLEWMQTQLDHMDGLGLATMAEMHEHTGVELTVTGADVTDKRLMILNHRTAPSLPVAIAVRMSMSAPFYWQEVIWDSAWGLYRGNDVTGHAIVDGGVLANFPIELFLSNRPFVSDIMGEANEQVLGLLIDDATPVPDQPSEPQKISTPSRLLNRGIELLETILQADAKDVLEAYTSKVIRLPAKGYQSFDFSLSDERINALVNAGERAAKQHLARPRAAQARDERMVNIDRANIDEVAARLIGV